MASNNLETQDFATKAKKEYTPKECCPCGSSTLTVEKIPEKETVSGMPIDPKRGKKYLDEGRTAEENKPDVRGIMS